mgnify:FL=1
MKENFDNKVANGEATEKKKYVSPEVEVFDLDNHAPLLAASCASGNLGGTLDENSDGGNW